MVAILYIGLHVNFEGTFTCRLYIMGKNDKVGSDVDFQAHTFLS